MKISWGWRISFLYIGFAVMIIWLVVASSRQKFDLVSKDYYKQEIAYQNVIDASKNEAELAGSLAMHANNNEITIEFPSEFSDKAINADIHFYSPQKQEWDRNFKIKAENNKVTVPRLKVENTNYVVKIDYIVDGKSYYSEMQINLHK